MAPLALAAVLLAFLIAGASAQSFTCSSPSAATCASGSVCLGLNVNPTGYNSFSVQECVPLASQPFTTCATASTVYGLSSIWVAAGFGATATGSLASCTLGPTTCTAKTTCSANFLAMSAATNSFGGNYSVAGGRTVPACLSYGYTSGGVVSSTASCTAETSSSTPTQVCAANKLALDKAAFAINGYTSIQGPSCAFSSAVRALGAGAAIAAAVLAATLAF